PNFSRQRVSSQRARSPYRNSMVTYAMRTNTRGQMRKAPSPRIASPRYWGWRANRYSAPVTRRPHQSFARLTGANTKANLIAPTAMNLHPTLSASSNTVPDDYNQY